MKTTHKKILLFVSPALVGFLFKAIFKNYQGELFLNLLIEIVFYLILCPLLFSDILKRDFLKKTIVYVAAIGSGISIFIESIYYYIYGASIGPSTLYFILQTNGNETFEFLENTIDIVLLSFSLLYLLFFWISLKNGQKLIHQFSKMKFRSNRIVVYGYCVFFTVLSGYMYSKDILEYNLPYLASKSIIDHHKFTDDFKDLDFRNKNGHFTDVIKTNSSDQETYVIIIGESTTRNRMQLYGYPKETNPRLQEIKDELLIYDDVISPHVGTILSLGKVLTTNAVTQNTKNRVENLGDLLKGEGYKKLNSKVGSIIQLFNNAGFKTFWLSNQRPMGIHENLVTEISKGADKSEYINIANFDEVTPYDGDLLPIYEKTLADSSPKKVIFLHLLGTHMDYKHRYPEDFNYFKSENITTFGKFISTKKKKEYLGSQYDNAIRYNDYFVREVIEKVRNTNTSSYVLYFSDHGEELNPKDDNPVGHYFDNSTASMYEIPFIVWLSEEFKKNKEVLFDPSSKFMTDNLIYTISDLSDISYKGFDASKSIFNTNYRERPRIIMNDKEFDTQFYVKDLKKSITKRY